MTGSGNPGGGASGTGGPGGGPPARRQPFSALAAMAWAITQVDPTVPEHKRLVARDQLIEACRRESVWASTFLAAMLAEAAAGIPASDPAWFLTGRIDVTVDDDRVRYLSRVPADPMLVPRREGVMLDEPGWFAARDSSWPQQPTDPDSTRWGRLVPAADREWDSTDLRQLAADLLYDAPPGDRALALVSFGLRSAPATQDALRVIGDEAWQRAGDQGLPFPARDGAAARAMTTAALEGIGWARRRSDLHAGDLPVGIESSRARFLAVAELAAQFANPGHFMAAETRGPAGPGTVSPLVPAVIPVQVRWMDPGLLADGPGWEERLVAGMRALVLPDGAGRRS